MSRPIEAADLQKLQNISEANDHVAWNDACDEIKKKYDGYPVDWYQKVLSAGLIPRS